MQKYMTSPSFIYFSFIFLLLFFSCANADFGDNITLYPTKLDAILLYDNTTYRNGTKSRETKWEAGLKIKQVGYLLDPKIAQFFFDIEPVFRWSEFDSETSSQETDGDLLSYLVQANLLRGTPGPLGFDLSAQRSDNQITGSLGNRFNTIIDSKKIVFHYKNRAFPSSLTYEKRLIDEEFRSSIDSVVIKRDELLQSLSLNGRSSKLQVHAERTELDDRISSRNNDYELNRVNVSHNFPWGRNSQLHSNVDYYDRDGFNANRRISLNETARTQHLDNVYSRTSYHYHSTSQTTENKEQGVDFALHHKLYKNLNSSAFVNVNNRDSDSVDEDKWRIGFSSFYNKNRLIGANMGAGVRISHQETDRISMLGLVDVVDESYVVPMNGAVILDDRFILSATIVVSDSTGNIIFDEGTDYTVLNVSGDLTQLLAVSGGRINTGDTILVSYNAQQLPSQNYTTTFSSYNLSFDFDWFRISHSDSKSNDKLISGASSSFLRDTRNTFSEVVFLLEPAGLNTQIGAERRFTQNSEFESTQYSFSQLITWTSSYGKRDSSILWNLNATQSFTEQVDLETDLYRINLAANWRPRPRLTIRPTLSIWRRIDEGSAIVGNRRDDKFYSAGIWAQWRFRKIDINFNFHHDKRTVTRSQSNERTGITEDHIMFTLKRRLM